MKRRYGIGVYGFILVMALALAAPSGAWASAAAVMATKMATKEKSASADASQAAPERVPERVLDAGSVDDIMARLTDAQVREMLIAELRKDAEAQLQQNSDQSPTMEQQALRAGMRLKQNIALAGEALPRLPEELAASLQRLAGEESYGALLLRSVSALAILGAAWLLSRWVVQRLQNARLGALTATPGPAEAMPRYRMLAAQWVVTFTGLLVFFLAAVAFYTISTDSGHSANPLTANVALAGLSLYVIWKVLDLLLSPRNAALRLLPLSDGAAMSFFRITMVLLALMILRMHLVETLAETGMSVAGLTLLRGVFGLLGLGLVLWTILHYRRPVSIWIVSRGGESPAPLLRQAAAIWHMLAVLYILIIALVWYAMLLLYGYKGPTGVFVSALAALPAFVLLDRAGLAMLRLLFAMFQTTPRDTATPPKLDDEGHPVGEAVVEKAPPPPDVATMKLFGPARAVMRLALCGFVLLGLLAVWGVDIPYGETIVIHILRIMLILAAGLGLWKLLQGMFARYLQRAEDGEANNPRFKTLMPLIQKVAGIFLLLSTALMLLSQLGVEIAPLLASAGVFGLAIGMGSQTLVKDVVAGVFFLMDDAFRVGDYIKMGSTEGFVTKMSVRNLTLVHYLGYVQLLPYGDISGVVNFSRNPIVMKLKVPLPMDTDPKLFKKICKKVNEKLMEDPEFKDDLVEPVKSQGVKRIEDSVMIYGIKYMTKPGKQWSIRKQIYSLLFKEFKKHGLKFAAPGVTVFTSSEKDDDKETDQTQAAAAAAAKMQQAQAAQAGKGAGGE